MNERENLKQAIYAVYGAECSTKEIDKRLKETYESLGEMSKGRRIGRIFTAAATAVGGLAASFLLLLGIGFANPAFAAQLPIMGSIIEFFRQSGYWQSPGIVNGGMEGYFKPEDASKDGFSISAVYCDGLTLALTTELEVENAPAQMREISPRLLLQLGGQQLERTDKMLRVDESRYVGIVMFDVTALNLTESFPLKLKLESAQGLDPKLMVLGDEGYSAKTYPLEFKDITLSVEVKINDSVNKVYSVNETQNGVSLERITVSPALTRIEAKYVGERRQCVRIVSDDKGRIVRLMNKYSADEELDSEYYYPLQEDVSSITISYYPMEDKENPFAQFTVPVTGGYGKIPDTGDWRGEQEPVVYDPPLEPGSYNYRDQDPNAYIAQLGETVACTNALKSGNIAVTLDNMQVYKDFEEAGLSVDDTIFEEADERWGDLSKSCFVMFDLTLDTTDAVFLDEEADSPSCTVDRFANPMRIIESTGQDDSYFCSETVYFSGHGTGWKDYYAVDLGFNGSKTFKVGYIVPVKDVESGNFQLYMRQTDRYPYDLEERMANGEYPNGLGVFFDVPAYNTNLK